MQNASVLRRFWELFFTLTSTTTLHPFKTCHHAILFHNNNNTNTKTGNFIMSTTTTTGREPKYIWKCACEKFQIKMFAEPLMSMNCYCHSCVAPVRYLDEKFNGKSTSAATADGNGAAKVFFALTDIQVVGDDDDDDDPSDKLGYVKVGDEGCMIRSYTKCCGTQLNTAGGDAFPCNFRPFNRNALYHYADDDSSSNQPFAPASAPPNVNCQHAFVSMDDIPEPKYNSTPAGVLSMFLAGIAKKKLGWGVNPDLVDKKIFYAKGNEVDDVIPITWEECS